MLSNAILLLQKSLALNTEFGGYTRLEDYFLGPFMLKSREMAYLFRAPEN